MLCIVINLYYTSRFTIDNKGILIDKIYENQNDFYNMSYTDINQKHNWVDSVIYDNMTNYIQKEKFNKSKKNSSNVISKKEIAGLI